MDARSRGFEPGVFVAHPVHWPFEMQPFIEVAFHRMERDRSVEAAVHRWVARLETEGSVVQRATITIDRSGRKRTTVCIMVTVSGGQPLSTTISHPDVYVAVSDAFRALRREVMPAKPRTRTDDWSWLAGAVVSR